VFQKLFISHFCLHKNHQQQPKSVGMEGKKAATLSWGVIKKLSFTPSKKLTGIWAKHTEIRQLNLSRKIQDFFQLF